MAQSKSKRCVALLLLVLFFPPGVMRGQRTKSSQSAGEQRSAEKGLKDNRYFFYFINSTITNLGTEDEKKIFREAIRRDMIAQLLYMKFMFHDSFVEIRKSQKLLIDLYRIILDKDLKMTKAMLNEFAPSAVRSKDHRARHYLWLGYRDVTDAAIDMGMADNYRESLFSMRLLKYVRAIKKAKHGKRYAFLSSFESSLPLGYKKEWHLLSFDELQARIADLSPALSSGITEDDRKELMKKLLRIEDLKEKRAGFLKKRENAEADAVLEEIKKSETEKNIFLKSLAEKYKTYGEKKEFYSLIHTDNFYKTREKSIFDSVWEKPELDEIKEFRGYLEKD